MGNKQKLVESKLNYLKYAVPKKYG